MLDLQVYSVHTGYTLYTFVVMSLYHLRRICLSLMTEHSMRLTAWLQRCLAGLNAKSRQQSEHQSLNPSNLDAFDPTAARNIESPYDYYRLLRDHRPVMKPAGQDFYCISRYEDIQAVARQTEVYSSNIVGVLLGKTITRLIDQQSLGNAGQHSLRNLGVNPVDVLAIQDPPAHKYQKLLTHKIVSADFVRALEADVQKLTGELLNPYLQRGEMEFMEAMAWPLPMRMAMRLVGFPEQDYPLVKRGCAHAIRLLSGTHAPGEFMRNAAEGTRLFRYCWKHYLRARRQPGDNITGGLVRAAMDPEHPLTDEEAVSIILQLLIAGSDSSASTMGNAVRLLIENPELQERLRAEPQRIGDFIEEVLRLESAFQGHFRILKQDAELHGQKLPRGTRMFLLWASGNRDERFWERPDEIDIDRPNLKKHITFGYGIHACLGRELARMEIRIVLAELLCRTRNLEISGPTPHVASLFTRTLVQLPLRFELAARDAGSASSTSTTTRCPAAA